MLGSREKIRLAAYILVQHVQTTKFNYIFFCNQAFYSDIFSLRLPPAGKFFFDLSTISRSIVCGWEGSFYQCSMVVPEKIYHISLHCINRRIALFKYIYRSYVTMLAREGRWADFIFTAEYGFLLIDFLHYRQCERCTYFFSAKT